ncbi:hypothetical protein PT974_07622 [Cladobotryum mycophilum]|uniref:Tautomerase cis-CaaD-like domain-containing protein n=1 Tax=Cladobotryum mycophilum TaxID=491253 RepID=A0ABR0SPS0_9HYPO
MPLWVVYHPPGTFSDDESKQAFSKSATSFYTSKGLPAFYVIVEFIQLNTNNTWIGGEKQDPNKPFVRIAIDHIARSMPDTDEYRLNATARLEELLKPHIADKGWKYEYHIDETDRRLWRIDGYVPPPTGSEAEQLWFSKNHAVPYDTEATVAN